MRLAAFVLVAACSKSAPMPDLPPVLGSCDYHSKTLAGTFEAGPCPVEHAIGRCEIGADTTISSTIVFYAPGKVEAAQSACTASDGKFTAL